MPDKVDFERSNGGTQRFFEKHIVTITQSTAVSDLVAKEEAALKKRNWGKDPDKRATINTLLCMTPGQQEQLFAGLAKFKAQELAAIKKNTDGYTNVSGCVVNGCVVQGGKAWFGGTWTLGISRHTGSQLYIVHLDRWDWTGRGPIELTAIFNVPPPKPAAQV